MTTSDGPREPDVTIDPETGLPKFLAMSDVWSKVVLTPAEASSFLASLSLIGADTQSDANVHMRGVAHALINPESYVTEPPVRSSSKAHTSHD